MKVSKRIKSVLAIVFSMAILFGVGTADIPNDISNVKAATQATVVAANYPQLYMQAHIEKLDWGEETNTGFAGTTTTGYRLEALKVGIKNTTIGGNIMIKVDSNGGKRYYQTANCGSMTACCGTTGRCQPVYSISMDLGGDIALRYDVVYRVLVTGEGWTEWVKNGEPARGRSGKIEAIEAHLVRLGITNEQFLRVVDVKNPRLIGTIESVAATKFEGTGLKYEGAKFEEFKNANLLEKFEK